jgi:hypothetical protein
MAIVSQLQISCTTNILHLDAYVVSGYITERLYKVYLLVALDIDKV